MFKSLNRYAEIQKRVATDIAGLSSEEAHQMAKAAMKEACAIEDLIRYLKQY